MGKKIYRFGSATSTAKGKFDGFLLISHDLLDFDELIECSLPLVSTHNAVGIVLLKFQDSL